MTKHQLAVGQPTECQTMISSAHSRGRVRVFYGRDEPVILCSYHADYNYWPLTQVLKHLTEAPELTGRN